MNNEHIWHYRKDGLPLAIVIGMGINGLGIARSLGARNIPVVGISSRNFSPCHATRYARILRISEISGQALVETIKNLSSQIRKKPVLFPTEEKAVEVVIERADELHKYALFKLPKREVARNLSSKSGFNEIALSYNLPVPRTWIVTRSKKITDMDVTYPCIVKASEKNSAYIVNCKKAYLVDDADMLRKVVDEILRHVDEAVVQEWIPGEDNEIRFCLFYCSKPGDLSLAFVGRKLYSWPAATGGTASCMPELNDEMKQSVLEQTIRFVKATGYLGIGSMEFKRHSLNDQIYMIEPTVGRSDYQEEVATLNGINIPWAMYSDLVYGEIPEQRQTEVPVVWKDGKTAIWSACSQGRIYKASSYPEVDSVWRWEDPLPGVIGFFERIKKSVARKILFRK